MTQPQAQHAACIIWVEHHPAGIAAYQTLWFSLFVFENPPAVAGVFCGCSCCCCVVSLSPTRGFLLTPPLPPLLSTMLYYIIHCIPSPMLYCLICIFLRRLSRNLPTGGGGGQRSAPRTRTCNNQYMAKVHATQRHKVHGRLESRRNTPAAVK